MKNKQELSDFITQISERAHSCWDPMDIAPLKANLAFVERNTNPPKTSGKARNFKINLTWRTLRELFKIGVWFYDTDNLLSIKYQNT